MAFLKGLGVGFLCLLLFVLGVVFNVEFLDKKPKNNDYLNFSRELEVGVAVKPDIVFARINFWSKESLGTKAELTQEDRENIAQFFNAVTERVKKDNLCTGGAYDLEPNFVYKDGLQILKGYRLNSSLECNFKEDQFDIFNHMLSDINAMVAKNDFIAVSTPALNPKFSSKLLEVNKENLYDEMIQKAYEIEKKYSKDLNKTCIVRSLNIASSPRPLVRSMSANLKSDASSSVMPIIEEEQQKIKAIVSFICK